jgi:hypothetical protein
VTLKILEPGGLGVISETALKRNRKKEKTQEKEDGNEGEISLISERTDM